MTLSSVYVQTSNLIIGNASHLNLRSIYCINKAFIKSGIMSEMVQINHSMLSKWLRLSKNWIFWSLGHRQCQTKHSGLPQSVNINRWGHKKYVCGFPKLLYINLIREGAATLSWAIIPDRSDKGCKASLDHFSETNSRRSDDTSTNSIIDLLLERPSAMCTDGRPCVQTRCS